MNLEDARTLALELIDEYLPGEGWSFGWNDRRRALGVTRYSTRTISLSRPLVAANGLEVVGDTIRHEIAHAIAGGKAAHGPQWKAACRVTGARPTYKAVGATPAPAPWWIVCANTGKILGMRYRRPALGSTMRLRCRCHGAAVGIFDNRAQVRRDEAAQLLESAPPDGWKDSDRVPR